MQKSHETVLAIIGGQGGEELGSRAVFKVDDEDFCRGVDRWMTGEWQVEDSGEDNGGADSMSMITLARPQLILKGERAVRWRNRPLNFCCFVASLFGPGGIRLACNIDSNSFFVAS